MSNDHAVQPGSGPDSGPDSGPGEVWPASDRPPPLFPDGQGGDLYRLVLISPGATAAYLARQSGLPVAAARAALGRLRRLGLVTGDGYRPRRYTATDPTVALGTRIRGLESSLQQQRHLLASFQELYAAGRSARAQSLLEVITGKTAIADRFLHAETAVQREILVFDCPPYIVPPGDPRQKKSEFALLERGVSVRSVYDRECLEDRMAFARMAEFSRAGERIRLAGDIPLKMIIFDRVRAILPLGPESGGDSAVIVRRSTVLSALINLFERVWAEATPLVLPDRAHPGAPGPSSGECRASAVRARPTGSPRAADDLLPLLAAGLGDAAIGRQLGVSERTVGRRVKALMDELGAVTRFQAGVEAARRGWLGSLQGS